MVFAFAEKDLSLPEKEKRRKRDWENEHRETQRTDTLLGQESFFMGPQ